LSCWGKIGWMENSGQKNSSLFEWSLPTTFPNQVY
jgi:hypothetical protein